MKLTMQGNRLRCDIILQKILITFALWINDDIISISIIYKEEAWVKELSEV